ncbi:guanosine polyphosphate pyrophosphohydrolase [Helicobacter sp. CLO-3]|uniref:Ppx/GppA phosphatase family protein n=1 Tax=unclassified Helicobacter TaxID=2593540 RepID=UPI0008052E58|nr:MULTISPECIES: Ppx/GppA phosphatase family protein [unclassified Helicobacter]OBV29725.1 guanosine polyphosphate pyrophosphohydrolase [Helicobacter sp. CLO-3]OHU82839.1 guanosine polyphosphate pyrophosphohydrolase [Helicobacter sp. CLO-3]
MAKITAVIDIGSNSARMAIFEKTSRYGFRLIYEIKSRVRISEGCYENGGFLQEEPMRRAINALKEFKTIAKEYAAKKLLCVATSAIRDAPNRAEFLLRARKESGVSIKVIDGSKEAWYGGVACANLSHNKSGITIDIGGGSTECAIIENGDIKELISLRLGTIRLKELFFDRHKNIDAAKDFIAQELARIPSHFKHDNVFGIGGTIRAIAKINGKQAKYPIKTIHGYEFSVKSAKSFIQTIYKTKEENLGELGVPHDRRDNIRSGALIFSMLLEHFGAKLITASGVGVREGVFLADMLRTQKYRFPPGIYPSLVALKDRFGARSKQGKNITKQALAIFEALLPLHKLKPHNANYLRIVGQLCDIGSFLNFYGRMDHGAYFLLHGLDYGFSHTDRAIVCLLVEYLNKRIPKDDAIAHINDIMPPIENLQWLSFILSLAYLLCITGEHALHYTYSDKCLYIHTKARLYIARESVAQLVAPTHIDIVFV